MLEIKKECDFCELRKEAWSGAVETLNKVAESRKVWELMDLLEEIFYEATDMITINDFLWFDRDYIYEQLEMEEEE